MGPKYGPVDSSGIVGRHTARSRCRGGSVHEPRGRGRSDSCPSGDDHFHTRGNPSWNRPQSADSRIFEVQVGLRPRQGVYVCRGLRIQNRLTAQVDGRRDVGGHGRSARCCLVQSRPRRVATANTTNWDATNILRTAPPGTSPDRANREGTRAPKQSPAVDRLTHVKSSSRPPARVRILRRVVQGFIEWSVSGRGRVAC
jgi:hypothetical protein